MTPVAFNILLVFLCEKNSEAGLGQVILDVLLITLVPKSQSSRKDAFTLDAYGFQILTKQAPFVMSLQAA